MTCYLRYYHYRDNYINNLAKYIPIFSPPLYSQQIHSQELKYAKAISSHSKTSAFILIFCMLFSSVLKFANHFSLRKR